jgi:hypothetical protein
MKDVGCLLLMDNGMFYHRGIAAERRKELEKMDGWGTWRSNSWGLNPIENPWHILRSNVRKRNVHCKISESSLRY